MNKKWHLLVLVLALLVNSAAYAYAVESLIEQLPDMAVSMEMEHSAHCDDEANNAVDLHCWVHCASIFMNPLAVEFPPAIQNYSQGYSELGVSQPILMPSPHWKPPSYYS